MTAGLIVHRHALDSIEDCLECEMDGFASVPSSESVTTPTDVKSAVCWLLGELSELDNNADPYPQWSEAVWDLLDRCVTVIRASEIDDVLPVTCLQVAQTWMGVAGQCSVWCTNAQSALEDVVADLAAY